MGFWDVCRQAAAANAFSAPLIIESYLVSIKREDLVGDYINDSGKTTCMLYVFDLATMMVSHREDDGPGTEAEKRYGR